jgi:hypothetical protein
MSTNSNPPYSIGHDWWSCADMRSKAWIFLIVVLKQICYMLWVCLCTITSATTFYVHVLFRIIILLSYFQPNVLNIVDFLQLADNSIYIYILVSIQHIYIYINHIVSDSFIYVAEPKTNEHQHPIINGLPARIELCLGLLTESKRYRCSLCSWFNTICQPKNQEATRHCPAYMYLC